MNRLVRATAERWLAEARPAVVVEVVQALGSAPREAGARMVVDRAQVVGTVGGGRLEWLAIAHARERLRRGDTEPRDEHFPLGPKLGQCCGGAVTLRYAPLAVAALADWPVAEPLFHLQLHGAGHVGRAIATLLCTLDVRVDWIDEREDAFPATTTLGTPWPAHIARTGVDAVEGEVRLAPPGGYFLVLTHDHDLDLRITEAVLRRGDFGFLGLIGSKTKRQRFVHRFEQRGVDPSAVARMTCPIGVPGIEEKAPELIAVAAVAQLLQVTTSTACSPMVSASAGCPD